VLGGHVLHRPLPAGRALYSREQAVESIQKGGRQALSPVGKDSYQMPFDHLGDSDHRFEQLTGLLPQCPNPNVSAAEELPGFLHILLFVYS
jgi:hypothetical protein